MNAGPTYYSKKHEYKPFQKRLGNQLEVQKLPPRTLQVTPELYAHYAKSVVRPVVK